MPTSARALSCPPAPELVRDGFVHRLAFALDGMGHDAGIDRTIDLNDPGLGVFRTLEGNWRPIAPRALTVP